MLFIKINVLNYWMGIGVVFLKELCFQKLGEKSYLGTRVQWVERVDCLLAG